MSVQRTARAIPLLTNFGKLKIILVFEVLIALNAYDIGGKMPYTSYLV